jgi:hypothetical protein
LKGSVAKARSETSATTETLFCAPLEASALGLKRRGEALIEGAHERLNGSLGTIVKRHRLTALGLEPALEKRDHLFLRNCE